MIFLTIGTTKFPFDRLLKAVDLALQELNIKEKLIVQGGNSQYNFSYPFVEVSKELSFGKIVRLLKEARIVITHGGPATIFLALKYSQNKPLVVPRSQRFREHVNNHQEIFANFLSQKKMIKAILFPENLEKQIGDYLKKPAILKEITKIEADKKLIENLINYTESLQ